jgi:hypothetical protein
LLDFIALNDLPTTNEIKPLAGKISHLTRDDVTQRSVALALTCLVAN